MFAHARNRHVEHARMDYVEVLRAEILADALGLNPLENGVEGVSQNQKSGWSCLRKEKKRKKQVFPQGSRKAFPVRPYFFQKFLTSVGSKNSYFSV